jgi:hypothetical protein
MVLIDSATVRGSFVRLLAISVTPHRVPSKATNVEFVSISDDLRMQMQGARRERW